MQNCVNTIIRKCRRIIHYGQGWLRSVLREALVWVYGAPQSWPRRVMQSSLYGLNHFASLDIDTSPGHVYLTRGLAAEGGLPFTVAFVGDWRCDADNGLRLYEHFFFQEGTTMREDLGVCPISQVRRTAGHLAKQVHLVAVTCNNLLLWRPSTGDWVTGPWTLRMAFDFCPGESWEDVQRRINQDYNLRVLRRAGLTYRISHREDDFQRFYHDMYVPLVKSRYREYGEIVKETDCHNVFKGPGGAILLIENPEGKAIAGGLENMWQGTLFAFLNGVIDGSQELIKKGALTAWYYFGMKRAFDSGCRRFDSGPCQPFLTDGVYIHKHRWGESPRVNLWQPQGVLFWAPESSPAALAWMKANPIHPRFAKAGGETMGPMYAGLAGDVKE